MSFLKKLWNKVATGLVYTILIIAFLAVLGLLYWLDHVRFTISCGG